jgi:hypothetical protein
MHRKFVFWMNNKHVSKQPPIATLTYIISALQINGP